MRTGIATVPLDYGRCPPWLFLRMKKLGRAISETIVEEFGPEEFLRRLSDPIWFQSLGCVLGFDWNSSGLTTTVLGALKVALFDIQDSLGIYVCGGKGKTSRKTPEEINTYGISRGFQFSDKLIYASKTAAKVDSALIQAGYQIYHHNFLFTKNGNWAVIQQGMNTENQTARRYHWYSPILKKDSEKEDFTEEPHSGIISALTGKPLNLVAKESKKNKEVSTGLVTEEPKTFLRDIGLILEKSDSLTKQKRLPGFATVELENKEFHWHPVLKENFNLKRLKKTVENAHFLKPKNFEELLTTKEVGPKTIMALSLVSEIIYGAKPSYDDPARYSFAHGGKDGTPFPVSRSTYDKTLEIIERGIKKSKISIQEKVEAQKRLNKNFYPVK
jgi:hypothetical protein